MSQLGYCIKMMTDPTDWLTKECDDRGLNLKGVLKSAGVTVSTFNRWKAGSTKPTFNKFLEIAEMLQGQRK